MVHGRAAGAARLHHDDMRWLRSETTPQVRRQPPTTGSKTAAAIGQRRCICWRGGHIGPKLLLPKIGLLARGCRLAGTHSPYGGL